MGIFEKYVLLTCIYGLDNPQTSSQPSPCLSWPWLPSLPRVPTVAQVHKVSGAQAFLCLNKQSDQR